MNCVVKLNRADGAGTGGILEPLQLLHLTDQVGVAYVPDRTRLVHELLNAVVERGFVLGARHLRMWDDKQALFSLDSESRVYYR